MPSRYIGRWKKSGWRSGPGKSGPTAPEQVAVQLLEAGACRRDRARRRVDERARARGRAGSARRRGGRPRPSMPRRPSSSAAPIPESSRSFGDSTVPAQTITSCSARTRSTAPFRTISTPLAASAVDEQPLRARSGQHLEVRRVGDRRQEGRRRALAHAVLDVELRVRDAVELLAVVVVVERDTRLLRGVDDRGVDGVRLVLREHVQRTAGPVVLAGAAVEVLRPLEQRQHVVVAPAVVPEVRPRVVVAAMAAGIDHPVERARAAEHLAARPLQLAVRACSLRDRPVAPVLLGCPTARTRAMGRGSPG